MAPLQYGRSAFDTFKQQFVIMTESELLGYFVLMEAGSMERIGIYGGSFNPPHIGHIRAAREAVLELGLDSLYLLPAGEVPGKTPPEGSATVEQRLRMLELAAEDCPNLRVSDYDACRERCRTWETVEHFARAHPGAELTVVVGSDQLAKLPDWENGAFVLEHAQIAVARRGLAGEDTLLREKTALLRQMGGRVRVLDNPVEPISSTQLRRLLAFGCGWEFLPPGAEDFIRREGLYHVNADWKNLPMEQLEGVVLSLLNPNRIRHVLGCRDTAVALAKRWGSDETDAARAGILHDITKALDGPLQLTLCASYGKMLTDFSRKYPKTLHALTGSLVAERIFGENPRVVSAICHHTTGRAGMSLLETIIYVADYMEPNRDFPGVERLRELAFTDIQAALKLGLEMTLEHLKKQGSEVSPESREALAYCEKRVSK